MAINTAEKRFSIMDFCGSATGVTMPLPSGTIDAGERLHFLGLYSGLGGGPPPPVSTEPPWSGFICNMGRMMTRKG